MIAALISAGLFVAVPLTGRALSGELPITVPAVGRLAVWTAIGTAVWSAPLLLLLIFGVYRPELLGGAGWIVVLLIARGYRHFRPWPRLSRVDIAAIAGVVAAGVLAGSFPGDPFATGRDQATYASHALHMLANGRLDLPYPWPEGADLPLHIAQYAGVHPTASNLTVRFGHVYPAWLAQAFAVGGYEMLVRLNVVLGVLSLLAIYGFSKRFVRPGIAAILVTFLAFNPAQIWTTRTTLSEILTQLLVWAGILLITAYLAGARPRIGTWAGVLLGLSALVRIDAFLILPFLFLAHALWIVLRRAGPSRSPAWSHVYLGALPTFAAAATYYAVFSQPYFLDLQGQLLQIAGLTTLCAALLGAVHITTLDRAARSIARHPLTRYLALAALLAVSVYAYFIRPIVSPFDVFDDPGQLYHGARTHIEDAFPNLGRYLTPGVVWLAVAGVGAAVVGTLKSGRSTLLLPLLAIGVGCTAVYAWNQSVFPDHFWAIRRFVPVIIPAVVMLAGLGATIAVARLSRPGQRFAVRASTVGLAIFTLWIGAPMYTVADRQGSYAWLRDFAESLPSGIEMIGIGGTYEAFNWWTPLLLGFGQPILAYDSVPVEGWREALAHLEQATPENPILLVTTFGGAIDGVSGQRIAQAHLARTVLNSTILPVPRSTRVEEVTLTAVEVTGLSTVGVELGSRPQWLAYGSGFYQAQRVDDELLRWTNGNARLLIPIYGKPEPTGLAVEIAQMRPGGGDVRIVLNGTVLFAGPVSSLPWSREFNLAQVSGVEAGSVVELEIVSSTFVQPSRVEDVTTWPPSDPEDNVLGVRLRSLRLLGGGP